MTAAPSPALSRDEMPGDGRHFRALDGLRCLAVMQVALTHFLTRTRPATGGAAVVFASNFFQFFGNGIHLFFVLSGFLITGILLRAKGSTNYFRVFYARRTLRIFPLYYGVLAAVFGTLAMLQLTGDSLAADAQEAWNKQAWLWTYACNVAIALFNHDFIVNSLHFRHFWTLATEEQFYLLWPLTVLLVSRRTLRCICVAACVGLLAARFALHGMHGNVRDYLLASDGLFAGSWLAAANIRASSEAAVARSALICAVGMFVIIGLMTAAFAVRAHLLPHALVSLVDRTSPIVETVQAITFTAIVYFCIVASPMSIVRRVLEQPIAVYIGKVSYGIYVYHYLLLVPFCWLGGRIASSIWAQPIFVWIVTVLIGLLLSLLTATISWTLFEAPILRLKRSFNYARNL